MFPSRYFPGNYWPRRMFPSLGATIAATIGAALRFVARRRHRPGRPFGR